jgi:hypothetical protein
MTRLSQRYPAFSTARCTPPLIVGILLAISLGLPILAAADLLQHSSPTTGPNSPAQAPEALAPSHPTLLPSNGSGFYVWFSGLPPNVSAGYVFGQFGPQAYWYASGQGRDGFDGGVSPLSPGVYDLYVQPAPGFIPVPASATYFVSGPELLNVSVSFVPATPCYQVFTEVGLPQGTEWWVIGAAGVAFFANNSVIDATGCGGLAGVTIGSSIGYQLVSYPPSAYYPSGAAVPLFFVPAGASSPPFPSVAVAVAGVLGGAVVAALYAFRRRGRGRADADPPPRSIGESEDLLGK